MVHTDTPNGLFGITRGAGAAVTMPRPVDTHTFFGSADAGYAEYEPGRALRRYRTFRHQEMARKPRHSVDSVSLRHSSHALRSPPAGRSDHCDHAPACQVVAPDFADWQAWIDQQHRNRQISHSWSRTGVGSGRAPALQAFRLVLSGLLRVAPGTRVVPASSWPPT